MASFNRNPRPVTAVAVPSQHQQQQGGTSSVPVAVAVAVSSEGGIFTKFQMCPSFFTNGYCNDCPSKCSLDHISPTLLAWTQRSDRVPVVRDGHKCLNFDRFQNCEMGNECEFVHVVNPARVPTKQTQSQTQSSSLQEAPQPRASPIPPVSKVQTRTPPIPQTQPSNKAQPFLVCLTHHNHGYCDKCPNNCQFHHVLETQIPWSKPKSLVPRERLMGIICEQFQNEQKCDKGEICPLVHLLNRDAVPTEKLSAIAGSRPVTDIAVCNQFRRDGFCSQCPTRCNLRHVLPTSVLWTQPDQLLPSNPKGRICEAYEATQRCKWGSQCKKVHIVKTLNVQTRPIKADVPAIMDLVVVMDCTQSKDFVAVQSYVLHLIDHILRSFNSSEGGKRLGFVAFRDYDVTELRVHRVSLSDNIDTVKEVIQRESGVGGGDIPDDVIGGLQEAIDDGMEWNASNKVLILVTEEPCNGTKYHEFAIDQCPEGYSGDPSIEEQMAQFVKMGISIVVVEVRPNRTKQMVGIMEKAYKETRSRGGELVSESARNASIAKLTIEIVSRMK